MKQNTKGGQTPSIGDMGHLEQPAQGCGSASHCLFWFWVVPWHQLLGFAVYCDPGIVCVSQSILVQSLLKLQWERKENKHAGKGSWTWILEYFGTQTRTYTHPSLEKSLHALYNGWGGGGEGRLTVTRKKQGYWGGTAPSGPIPKPVKDSPAGPSNFQSCKMISVA